MKQIQDINDRAKALLRLRANVKRALCESGTPPWWLKIVVLWEQFS